jgi:hypothetical protein
VVLKESSDQEECAPAISLIGAAPTVLLTRTYVCQEVLAEYCALMRAVVYRNVKTRN